jgi:hypothetical protein
METHGKTVLASLFAIVIAVSGGQSPTSAIAASDNALWTADRA